jgi:hypothetical protein
MCKSAESPSTPLLVRRWYQPHRSTWLLLPIFAGVAVIVVAPGDFGKYPDCFSHERSNNNHAAIVHGWPLPFLWRTPFRWLDEPNASPGAKAWRFNDSVRQFSWVALATDVAIAVAGVAAALALVEWRRRRRNGLLQFTLRELFVCMTGAAVLFGWWMHRRRANSELDEHLSRISTKGWQTDPDFPLWIRNIVGDELLSRSGLVRPRDSNYLYWNRSRCDDIQLVITEFPHETTLVLHSLLTDDGDTAIAHLNGLANLECDQWDLAALQRSRAAFGNLRSIRCFSPVDDAELAQFATISKLESLVLSNASGVTIVGWKQLGKLTRLHDLSIERADLMRDSTKLFGELESLRRLSIFGSTLTDSGIANLSRLANLEELDLGGAQPTDDGLRPLQNLRRLRYLGLYGAKLTATNLRAMATTSDGSARPFQRLRTIDLRAAAGFKLADVSALADLESLDELRIYAHDINAEAIQALKSLPHLRRLDVAEEMGSGLPLNTLEVQLQKALPNCQICVEW